MRATASADSLAEPETRQALYASTLVATAEAAEAAEAADAADAADAAEAAKAAEAAR